VSEGATSPSLPGAGRKFSRGRPVVSATLSGMSLPEAQRFLSSIRPAQGGDFDPWLTLYEAVAAERLWMGAEAPLDPVARRESFDRSLIRDDAAIFLAEDDGRRIGAVNLTCGTAWSTWACSWPASAGAEPWGAPWWRRRWSGPGKSEPTRRPSPCGPTIIRPAACTPNSASGPRAPAGAATAGVTGNCGTP
jgi:hypothetical protein